MQISTRVYAITTVTFEEGDDVADYATARDKAIVEAERLYPVSEGYKLPGVSSLVTINGLPMVEVSCEKE